MAAFTVKASGNWSAAGQTTWNEVGVPTDGDTVACSGAFTVHVDTNTTVGTSNTTATTIDVTFTAGKLIIDPGVTLTMHGGMLFTNAQLEVGDSGGGGGASLIVDSTGVVGNPCYRIHIGDNTSQPTNKISAFGTAGSHAVIRGGSTTNRTLIQCGFNSVNFTVGCRFTYTDFSFLGTGTFVGYNADGLRFTPNGTGSQEGYIENCTFTDVGRIFLCQVAAAGDVVFRYNRIISTAVTDGQMVEFDEVNAPTTGLRIITDNVMPTAKFLGAGQPYWFTFGGRWTGWTVERNQFCSVFSTGMSTFTAFASFKDNMFVARGALTNRAMIDSVGAVSDVLQDSYGVDDTAEAQSAGFIGIGLNAGAWTGTCTVDGFIFDSSRISQSNDFGDVPGPTSGTHTYVLQRLICLPDAAGRMSAAYNGHGSGFSTVTYQHNTMMMDDQVSDAYGAHGMSSGYISHANMYANIKNNIFWSKAVRSGGSGNWGPYDVSSTYTGTADAGGSTTTLVDAAPTPAFPGASIFAQAQPRIVITGKTGSGPEVGEYATVTNQSGSTITFTPAMSAAPDTGTTYNIHSLDIITVANYTKNAFYNAGNGTIRDEFGNNPTTVLGANSFWSSSYLTWNANNIDLSTGTNELTQGPKFVDTSRNVATFDSVYLGNSATAWADATPYVVGDMVSAASAAFFGNVTINYRCVTAHTSNAGNATNGKPGGVAGYRTNWEFASVYRIREATIAGTTITDASLSLTSASYIKTLYTWVRKGFAPQNTALRGVASDATDIGAVPVTATNSSMFFVFTQQT